MAEWRWLGFLSPTTAHDFWQNCGVERRWVVHSYDVGYGDCKEVSPGGALFQYPLEVQMPARGPPKLRRQ